MQNWNRRISRSLGDTDVTKFGRIERILGHVVQLDNSLRAARIELYTTISTSSLHLIATTFCPCSEGVYLIISAGPGLGPIVFGLAA